MSLHFRHIHLRKRHSRSLEPYPARTAWKRWLDRVVYVAGVAGPIMTLPQIILIYTTRDASGVAPITWLAWASFNLVWIFYGVVHREPPIALTHTLWFIFNSLVLVGALLYG